MTKLSIWTKILLVVLSGFYGLSVYAEEIVVNKKGEPILLKDDGTWEVVSTKGEEGKVVFSIRKGTDKSLSYARKDDMDEYSHHVNYVGCDYIIEVTNKTEYKIKINSFHIATKKNDFWTPDALAQFDKLIEPGNSFVGKGDYGRGWIYHKGSNTKQLPTDDQIKKWQSQYGCEAQKGSIFIKSADEENEIVFSKTSGISDDAKSSFLMGSNKGMYPLMKEINLR
jgi:hypothetical protein